MAARPRKRTSGSSAVPPARIARRIAPDVAPIALPASPASSAAPTGSRTGRIGWSAVPTGWKIVASSVVPIASRIVPTAWSAAPTASRIGVSIGRIIGQDYRQDRREYRRDVRQAERRWDRRWRQDARYDWQRYRYQNRNIFSPGRYYSPYRGHSYSRFSIGLFLEPLFYNQRYWLGNPGHYRLPAAYPGTRWVRYYDDVLLVDVYSGEVVDVIYDFFW
jgi:hypothetical protein